MNGGSDSAALWQLGVAEASSCYGAGRATPIDMVESVLQRVAEVNPALNAFAKLDVEGARAAAGDSAERWRDGCQHSPLDGIVLTIKDNITVKGLPCAWGTELFRDFIPELDEVPVARLREAGAIILGKTTVSEFSNGRGIVSTRLFGTTHNPWRPALTTGSSSAGAAAAVASGMGAAALGTDGGGSIRIPASHCGLVGLKPTVGRVARADGLPVIFGGREVVGPIARSTVDLAILMRAIAGTHHQDATSWGLGELPPGELDPAVAPQRILYVPRIGDYPVAPAVTLNCARVAANLAAMGHRVEEGEAPFNIAMQMRSGAIVQAGLAWLVRDRDWRGRIDEYYARQIEAGSRLSAADYVDALSALREVQGQIGKFFQGYDMMLSPVTGALPGPADEPAPGHYTVFTSIANTAGVPAISIPSGLSPDGLPIGFQLMGRFGADWDLLGMGLQYEQHHSWLDRWPPRLGVS